MEGFSSGMKRADCGWSSYAGFTCRRMLCWLSRHSLSLSSVIV